jgi:acyl dehydratase
MDELNPDIPEEIRLEKQAGMASIFTKGVFLSLFRPGAGSIRRTPEKACFRLNDVRIESGRVEQYAQVCGFPPNAETVPVTFCQTLFTSLMGHYFTSGFFPASPMGLIHVRQMCERIHPLRAGKSVDLSLSMDAAETVEKGLEITFGQTVSIQGEPFWKGSSTFLLKRKGSGGGKKTKQGEEEKEEFSPLVSFAVPVGTGRRYASVSGDYNPHHVSGIAAKLMGFKTPIAHGMWTMARCAAEIETLFDSQKQGMRIAASFKKPVFMPSRVSLSFRRDDGISFVLENEQTGIPHIRGHAG